MRSGDSREAKMSYGALPPFTARTSREEVFEGGPATFAAARSFCLCKGGGPPLFLCEGSSGLRVYSVYTPDTGHSVTQMSVPSAKSNITFYGVAGRPPNG